VAETQLTCGEFSLESDAERFFDSVVPEEYFVNEREVVGRRLFDDKPIYSGYEQKLRIDRILHPTDKAMGFWKYGPIGIELKKSGVKMGPVFAQIIEQRQTLFLSKWLNNTRILPMLFAVFPAEPYTNDLHSIGISQSILCCAYDDRRRGLVFSNGNISRILMISKNGIEVDDRWQPTTRKGHRG